MKQVQEIFQRYEKKYLLDEKSFRTISRELEERMLPDRYGESVIRSLYFDTPDRRLIRASLEKPVYKEKLRLRGYTLEKGHRFCGTEKEVQGRRVRTARGYAAV